MITVSVTSQGDGAIAGQSFTLECGVSGAERLGGNITYVWTRGNTSLEGETNRTYTFTPTAGDNGVMYFCAATVNSSSLRILRTDNGFVSISVLGELCYLHTKLLMRE